MAIQPLVALDVGSTKVACAIGLPHERTAGFELLGTSVMPYPVVSEAGLNDPLMVGHAIEQALEATAVHADFQRALVAFSHPQLGTESSRVSLPLGDEPMTVRLQDLDRLQAAAVDRVVAVDREPLLVERLSCSGNGFDQVRNPHGLSASRLVGSFHIVTMPLSARRALVQAVESAGLEVAQLTYALVAAWAAVAQEVPPQARVLLIDVGGLQTDLGLIAEGVLQGSVTVPVGGVRTALQIASRLGATLEQASVWNLEGRGCRNEQATTLIEASWQQLEAPLATLLAGQPKPDQVWVMGRGGLADGFVEAIERLTGVKTAIARSSRTQRFGDLSRQVSLTAAIGLLEQATHVSGGAALQPTDLFNRLLHRTRTLLTEYF
jgi:cell division protein FtsA